MAQSGGRLSPIMRLLFPIAELRVWPLALLSDAEGRSKRGVLAIFGASPVHGDADSSSFNNPWRDEPSPFLAATFHFNSASLHGESFSLLPLARSVLQLQRL